MSLVVCYTEHTFQEYRLGSSYLLIKYDSFLIKAASMLLFLCALSIQICLISTRDLLYNTLPYNYSLTQAHSLPRKLRDAINLTNSYLFDQCIIPTDICRENSIHLAFLVNFMGLFFSASGIPIGLHGKGMFSIWFIQSWLTEQSLWVIVLQHHLQSIIFLSWIFWFLIL